MGAAPPFRRPHRWPVPLTSLVGRDREIADVARLLAQPEARLLTLTGPGGTGKTRLALRAAEEATAAFPDGRWFVALASVVDVADLAAAIARALDLREASDRALIDRLADHIASLRCLLVLDNLEQLLPAAGQTVASLLADCPRLTILATSRERLHVSGEREIAVLPLDVPDPRSRLTIDELAATEALRLFVERVRDNDPTFHLDDANASVVAEIVRRLDGLPLAIELAAARVKLLPPIDLLRRLDRRLPLLTGGAVDLPSRQRTLRLAIAWSYDLLTPDEQALFRRMAVFVSGFSIDSADGVLGTQTGDACSSSPPVLDGLGSLVDKSLVRRRSAPDGTTRFAMLETIREFALEQLTERGEEAEIRERHADWFLERSEQLWTALIRGPIRVTWLNWADAEHGNLRAAMTWCDDVGDLDRVARFVAALWPFWMVRHHLREWRAWLARTLPGRHQLPPALRARLLMAVDVGTIDGTGFEDFLGERLALYQDLGDTWGIASAGHSLGMQAIRTARFDDAEERFTAALADFERIGADDWVALLTHRLGMAAYGAGNLDRATSRFAKSLDLHRALDDPWGTALCLSFLALLAIERADLVAASTHLGDTLLSLREVGDVEELLHWCAMVAMLAAARADQTRAARLIGAFDALTRRLAIGDHLPRSAAYERTRQALTRQLGQAAFDAAWAAGQRLAFEEAIAMAEDFLQTGTEPIMAPSPPPSLGSLTGREVEVLCLVARGRTNPQIADQLFISLDTVKRHVSNILGKLELANRSEATRYALSQGLCAE